MRPKGLWKCTDTLITAAIRSEIGAENPISAAVIGDPGGFWDHSGVMLMTHQ